MSNPLPTRPYNSYNLFFQLEREFILQTLLGYQPTIASKDIFYPTDKTYPAKGPPLPSRYENLILPYDWYIPGKNRRRKRSHRKSHGKIGFHELNEQISKAWSVADDGVRNFCACLSDIGSRKYKKVKRKTAKKEVKRTVTKTIKTEPEDDDYNDLFLSFDWTANFPNFSEDDFDSNSISSPKMCRIASRESVDVDHEGFSQATSSRRKSFTEVDMEDDEIMDIWKATHIEDDAIQSILSLSQICVEIVNPTANITTKEEEDEEEGLKQQDDIRKSFIDAEYEKFKEIGKQFSTKQMSRSKLKRNTFAACQA